MHSGSFSQFSHYLREKWLSPRRIRFWLLLLLVLVMLLGFFAIPPLVEHMAKKTVRENFDRELQVETVRVNPLNLTFRINELTLLDTDEISLINVEQIHIDIAWSSLFSNGWTINAIRIENPVLHEERFASGETRYMRLAQTGNEEDEAEEEDSDLAFRINFLHIENGELRFTDNFGSSPNEDAPSQVTLALEKIDFDLEDLAFNDDTRASVQFEGYLAGGGELTFEGTVQLNPSLALQGDVGINGVEFLPAAPYLQHFIGVQLESGALSVNGTILSDAQQPLEFNGDARIDALRISQAPEDETLLSWESLHTERIDFDFKASELETDIITLEGLAGQLVINNDQTTNFGELFNQSADDEATDEESTDDERAGDNADEAIAVQTDNDGAAHTAEGRDELTPFGVVIKGIVLMDGALEFSDDSLPLPFSTSIHSLNGEVSTISSTSAEPARLELEGQVDDYGLARAEGQLHTFDPVRQTEINVTFRNLEIPEYSPYTVNFAGRMIAGGALDLDLQYTIDYEQLQGENNMVIRDLELGEHIDGDDRMELPLRIAIALLEDSDGVIDLTLPVSGDVDDPEFDVNAIIIEALWRALTTIVEAPFRLLADAIGSDSEDLGQVDFARGRTDLAPPQRERIAELQQALNARPTLILQLAGPYSREFDGPAIKQQQATQALREFLDESDQDEEEPNLTSEDHQDAVESLFASYYPESDVEAVRERFTEEQNGQSDFDDLAYRNYLAQQIIAMQAISDEELQALGNARAAAVRDALLEETDDIAITENRIQITDPVALDSVDSELITLEIEVTAD